MKKEQIEDIKIGDLVIFDILFKKRKERCVGFVHKITNKKFYLGWYQQSFKGFSKMPEFMVYFEDIINFKKFRNFEIQMGKNIGVF